MESDSKKRQLWFNETIKNNHIILRCSIYFFKKRIDIGDVNVWSRVAIHKEKRSSWASFYIF